MAVSAWAEPANRAPNTKRLVSAQPQSFDGVKQKGLRLPAEDGTLRLGRAGRLTILLLMKSAVSFDRVLNARTTQPGTKAGHERKATQ